MSVAAILLLIPVTIILLFSFLSFKKNAKPNVSTKFPSGYSGLPFFGETLSFLKPHLATTRGRFMDLRISRFGRIFSSNIFWKQVIFSADAELNRFVMKNERRLFAPGWPPASNKLVGQGSIFLAVGDVHKHLKSAILEFLSSEKVRTILLRAVEHRATLLMSSWKEGTVFSAKQEATKFSFYIMVKDILSMIGEEAEIEKLRIAYDQVLSGCASLPVYLPGTTYWKALQSRKTILKIIGREMKIKKADVENKNSRIKEDFLGWLLTNSSYSQERIGDILLGLLLAGHDTTSRAISALIYFLRGCPSAIEQLREEHHQVIRSKVQKAENKFTWDDYNGLDFTKCVINETLRLANVATVVPKMATQDIKFKGYVIWKGCNVMLHHKAVHLDPLLYENPEQFNPWRWQSLSTTHITNNFMAFGGGVRFCPGSELARMQMTVFLHHLIMKYDWELTEPDHPMNIPFVDFPKGLPIKVRARSTE